MFRNAEDKVAQLF
jgi:hypothetical protein